VRGAGGAIAACALALVPVLGGAARAGGSAPVVGLTGATVVRAASGARALRVTGTFNFDDLVQFSFPCGVFLVQGTRLVRWDLSGTIVEATAPQAADGILPSEVPGLLALAGAPAAPAALLRVETDRLAVALPADLAAGPAAVVLYADYDGESWVSDAVTVTLP
jgi:hypothetical protein